jgi:hypothetical protein
MRASFQTVAAANRLRAASRSVIAPPQEENRLAAAELEEMAEDELARALTLSWRELSRLVPWGDTYEGFAPSGRAVQVERNYLWAEGEGGDILCEVAVFTDVILYDNAARRSGRIARPA